MSAVHGGRAGASIESQARDGGCFSSRLGGPGPLVGTQVTGSLVRSAKSAHSNTANLRPYQGSFERSHRVASGPPPCVVSWTVSWTMSWATWAHVDCRAMLMISSPSTGIGAWGMIECSAIIMQAGSRTAFTRDRQAQTSTTTGPKSPNTLQIYRILKSLLRHATARLGRDCRTGGEMRSAIFRVRNTKPHACCCTSLSPTSSP
jgi:hypothetical protein